MLAACGTPPADERRHFRLLDTSRLRTVRGVVLGEQRSARYPGTYVVGQHRAPRVGHGGRRSCRFARSLPVVRGGGGEKMADWGEIQQFKGRAVHLPLREAIAPMIVSNPRHCNSWRFFSTRRGVLGAKATNTFPPRNAGHTFDSRGQSWHPHLSRICSGRAEAEARTTPLSPSPPMWAARRPSMLHRGDGSQ